MTTRQFCYTRYLLLLSILVLTSISSPASANIEELTCLAKNLYFEARGEPEIGQIAVGLVTLNRVASPKFPNTVCKVVRQSSNNKCQFSWYCDKNSNKLPDNEASTKAKKLAEQLLLSEHEDITKGALFFHSKAVKPRWTNKLEKTFEVGNHIFYGRSSILRSE